MNGKVSKRYSPILEGCTLTNLFLLRGSGSTKPSPFNNLNLDISQQIHNTINTGICQILLENIPKFCYSLGGDFLENYVLIIKY